MKQFEIEQKFRIKNPAHILKKLNKLHARKIKGGVERNEFFDRKSELRKKGMALRLRSCGKGKAILTLKGPRVKHRYSKRLEFEMEIDGQIGRAMICFLGYHPIAAYRKRRVEFKAGKALICLDEVPRLGRFLEIEAPNAGIIKKLAQQLGLGEKDREERTYFTMLFR